MASDFPVTYLLTLPRYLVVSSVDMKNLKILITYFLLEPLGCALVDPNVPGIGGPGPVTLRPLGWRRVVGSVRCGGEVFSGWVKSWKTENLRIWD